MTSTRLPGKVLMEVLGRPLLSYQIERLRLSREIDKIIIATTVNKEDDPIENFAQQENIRVYRGSENDVLDRYYQAARQYQSEHIVRITADCPLIQPDICDQVARTYIKSDVDYAYMSRRFAEGLGCEIFNFSTLERAWKEARMKSEREHVTLYIRNHPDMFQIIRVENKADDSQYRLAVDEKEDFLVVKATIENLYIGQDNYFTVDDIKRFLDTHPIIYELNAHIIRNEGLLKSLKADTRRNPVVLHTDGKKPVVLVTAVGAPPGLNTLRFLHESGKYRLVAADADPLCTGLYQFAGFGVTCAVLPKASNSDEYLKAVCGLIEEHNISAIIPCIEEEILVLAQNCEKIKASGANVLLPNYEVLRVASNKALSTQVAGKNDIPCPKGVIIPKQCDTWEVSKILESFAKTCSLPWIVKPVYGHGMIGITEAATLDKACQACESAETELFVQEYIPGKVGSMHLVGLLYDWDGRVVCRFSSRSFRTLYPTGGPATAGISIHLPELITQTERLLSCIGSWKGPAAVEWMLDPRDGRFKYIEINARLWGYSSLAVCAGSRFHEWLADLTLGNGPVHDPGFREGVVMMRTTHDVLFQTCPFDLNI